jgi:Tol biopolymer transport system component
MKRSTMQLASTWTLCLLLAACGSGGSGGGSSDDTTEAPFAGLVVESDPDGFGTSGDASLTFDYQGVAFYGECVRSARSYYQARYGITLPFLGPDGGAFLFWDADVPPGMYRVPNDGTVVPQPDDMIVWRPWVAGDCGYGTNNRYGHVAVVVAAPSRAAVTVVDSNWVSQMKGGEHVIGIGDCVYGWYRPAAGANPFTGGVPIERLASIGQVGIDAHRPAISGDGRFVAYAGAVPGSNNYNVILADRVTGVRRVLSIAADQSTAGSECQSPSISNDGATVAFNTMWGALASDDANGAQDMFVIRGLDRTRVTTLASRSASGAIGNANSWSYGNALSPDGNWLAFISSASNLVPGDTNGKIDVFLKDLRSGTIIPAGWPPGSGTNSGDCWWPSVSLDGQVVVFQYGDGIRAFRRATSSSEIVSLADDGTPATRMVTSPSVTPDGRYVAFLAFDDLALDGWPFDGWGNVYIRDRQLGHTRRVSIPLDGKSRMDGNTAQNTPSMSADGRYVAFASESSNLVSGDTNGMYDVFVRDMKLGITARASVSSTGGQADGWSTDPVISADGRYVAFASRATNLVAGDANGPTTDVYVAPNPLFAAEGMRGVDFSFDRPSMSALAADGDQFVIRYLAGGTSPGKELTSAEVASYLAAGLKVCVVWEKSAGRAALGQTIGAQDARDAAAQATALGLGSIPIHFAVDSGLSWAQVSDYFEGALSVLGAARTGIYGGIRPVTGAADRGIKYLWQTAAWSAGQWDPRATMRQVEIERLLGGARVDVDYAFAADYGQFGGP